MRFLAPFSRLASVQLPACGTSNHRGSAGCADAATWVDSDGDGVGDLAGLTRRLDYLSGLGVTTLWLMPSASIPGSSRRAATAARGTGTTTAGATQGRKSPAK